MSVKHIVMWKIEGDNKEDRALKIKEALESLRGKIEGLLAIEVGIDFSKTADSSDILLYTEFKDKAALDAYGTNPEHLKVIPIIKELRGTGERRVVDYNS